MLFGSIKRQQTGNDESQQNQKNIQHRQKFEDKQSQIIMQTNQSNKIFSILKNGSDCLIFQSQGEKFTRKTFTLKLQTLNHLIERQKLSHPTLINLHRIELSHQLNQDKFAVQIVFDHYCKILDQCIIGQNSQWDDSEIINTFEPIVEFVDQMVNQKIMLSEFSLKNIVITEDQKVKFVDSFLENKEIIKVQITKDTNNFNQHKIYHKIADNIFSLVCPKEQSTNWKNRMKILKLRKSKEMCSFISSVLSKSISKGCEVGKTKKIKKTVKVLKNQNIEEVSGKHQKEDKRECLNSSELNIYGKHQGKENKLQQ